MPGGNRTGPEGKGPATGRGLGYCTGSDTPGYTKGPGIGLGRGLGGGRLPATDYPQKTTQVPQTTQDPYVALGLRRRGDGEGRGRGWGRGRR